MPANEIAYFSPRMRGFSIMNPPLKALESNVDIERIKFRYSSGEEMPVNKLLLRKTSNSKDALSLTENTPGGKRYRRADFTRNIQNGIRYQEVKTALYKSATVDISNFEIPPEKYIATYIANVHEAAYVLDIFAKDILQNSPASYYGKKGSQELAEFINTDAFILRTIAHQIDCTDMYIRCNFSIYLEQIKKSHIATGGVQEIRERLNRVHSAMNELQRRAANYDGTKPQNQEVKSDSQIDILKNNLQDLEVKYPGISENLKELGINI